MRDETTLARPWAIPGTPGLMHRIGGIEKQDGTGNVNYEPENHELMTHLRAEKIARIANDIPLLAVDDPRTTTPRCSCSGGGARGARSRPRPGASAPRTSRSRPRS